MRNVAALFDLDGVIIDTEPQYTAFWTRIGASLVPDIADFAHKIKGQTLTAILSRYFPVSETQRQVVAALESFEAEMSFPLVAGAIPFVDALRAVGVPTAVVTSSDKAKMRNLLRRIPDFTTHFTAIFTAEDAVHSKPAPDCYLNAAARLGLSTKRCAIFEDSTSGLRAARAAGGHVVALATSQPADMLQPLADCVIPDFTAFTVEKMLALIGECD